MKLLIFCPGKIAPSLSKIGCFTDVLNYYLPKSLDKLADCTIMPIPDQDNEQLQKIFSTLEINGYDAIVTLGLRFYSKISPETTALLRDRFDGLFCQVHDGTRMDHDPVDITFTFKDDSPRLQKNPGWYARHIKHNVCMGWATDPEVNTPKQNAKNLRILVDHTNYGNNETDLTKLVLTEVKRLIDQGKWQSQFEQISVRRFDSGRVVDVDFDKLTITKYNRTPIPFDQITQEHCAAHVFCVTHPESVGLVVLETAMAGAIPVVPRGFVPRDRLDTINHVAWDKAIPWNEVLAKIDVEQNRTAALANNWDTCAGRIVDALNQRLGGQS